MPTPSGIRKPHTPPSDFDGLVEALVLRDRRNESLHEGITVDEKLTESSGPQFSMDTLLGM